MRNVSHWLQRSPVEPKVPAPKDFGQIANELCENALKNAREQLHPLLREAQLERLDKRPGFVIAFKRTLEQRIARKLAAWEPGTQAIFQFDETRIASPEAWDGSIHLLAKVPHLSETLKILGSYVQTRVVFATSG